MRWFISPALVEVPLEKSLWTIMFPKDDGMASLTDKSELGKVLIVATTRLQVWVTLPIKTTHTHITKKKKLEKRMILHPFFFQTPPASDGTGFPFDSPSMLNFIQARSAVITDIIPDYRDNSIWRLRLWWCCGSREPVCLSTDGAIVKGDSFCEIKWASRSPHLPWNMQIGFRKFREWARVGQFTFLVTWRKFWCQRAGKDRVLIGRYVMF